LIQFVNWTGDSTATMRKFAYICILVTLIFVPIAGVVHWVLDLGATLDDEENNLKAWLFVYPLVCIFSIIKYAVMHK